MELADMKCARTAARTAAAGAAFAT